MKIITGAAGYIGGSIAEKLIVSGHEVTGLARSEEQVPPLKTEGSPPSSAHWTIPRS